jgi:hypothetical protein
MKRCDKCKKLVMTVYTKVTKEKGRMVKIEQLCEKCTDYFNEKTDNS